MIFDVGRVCVKIAGRDAGKTCVVVDIIDDSYVLIDGQTRRKKCNVFHLEPLDKSVDIPKGADHEAVKAALDREGVAFSKKVQPKNAPERPKKAHIVKKSKK